MSKDFETIFREFSGYDGPDCVCCNSVTNKDSIRLLLDDNLVWDKDFDSIRLELANLLTSIDRYVSRSGKQAIKPELDKLNKKLLGE